MGLDGLASAIAKGARFAQRQRGAGAQLLLQSLLERAGVGSGRMVAAEGICATGQDLALAIRTGRADCGIGRSAEGCKPDQHHQCDKGGQVWCRGGRQRGYASSVFRVASG